VCGGEASAASCGLDGRIDGRSFCGCGESAYSSVILRQIYAVEFVFSRVCAEIACFLLRFCSEYHQRATFIIVLLEISIQRVSERATACLYI